MKFRVPAFAFAGLLALSSGFDAEAEEVTLYIVRHGKTMLNTTDRVQGWSDAVLTSEGEAVVKAAGRGLKDVVFQAAYSSDSGRAMQTARLILAESETSANLPLADDARLREFNFGTFEGDLNKTMWSAIAADRGITLEEFMTSLDPESFANSVARLDAQNPEAASNWPAENYEQITGRLAAGLADIVETESARGEGNVLVVSHGLSIMALLDTLFADFEAPQGGIKNASVTIVKVKDGAYSLEEINDLSFVEAGGE